jgi:diacylglycerol kinase (ATP)
MSEHKNQPFMRRVRFALAGLASGWRTEHSLRYQLGALICVVVALIVLRLEPIWWALVALTSCSVIAAEMFNTALEHLADHLHPDIHPKIRIVKDCAAAAVLVASCGALTVAVAVVVHLSGR